MLLYQEMKKDRTNKIENTRFSKHIYLVLLLFSSGYIYRYLFKAPLCCYKSTHESDCYANDTDCEIKFYIRFSVSQSCDKNTFKIFSTSNTLWKLVIQFFSLILMLCKCSVKY